MYFSAVYRLVHDQWRIYSVRKEGVLGTEVPQKLTLFVNECLNFDVLEEKIVKRPNTIIKIMVS